VHLTLGARCPSRTWSRSADAVEDGSFFDNAALVTAATIGRGRRASPLHLINWSRRRHSHIDHLIARIELARRHGARPQLHYGLRRRDTALAIAARRYLPRGRGCALARYAIGSVSSATCARSHRLAAHEKRTKTPTTSR
jgi:2,3-bisphosphoglycerate-independent phosphoglycerate mutase